MLGRIVNSNNVSVEPWGRVRRRLSLGETDRVRSNNVVVVVFVILLLSCYLVVIVVIRCRSFVSLSSFRSSTVYGITIASIQFSSILPFFIFAPSYLPVTAHHGTPPTHPFLLPPQSKNVAFIPKLTLFTDFRPFFARIKVKYEPISEWLSLSDSP